ncbi:MAG: hypothetical protein IJW36_02385 [Clostridia bacterium]|nr:hypothetical protein [Clostridia bacterium]
MKSQAKVKFLIMLAVVILIAIFALLSFQLFKINQIKKQIAIQKNQISNLEQQIDFYENKQESTEYDTITGDN